MTKEREALTMALEALEAHADIGIKSDKAITTIKETLAQPEQAFAGVKVWVGGQQVMRGATREDLHHADDPWMILQRHSEVCIAALKEKNA